MIRHSILSVACESDALLHHIAALGLAAARGTALVVDLDDAAPAYPGVLSVATLIAEGVHRDHLGPTSDGVAVLPNGGAEVEAAVELIESLASGWPAIVVRRGPTSTPFPHVPVVPSLPFADDPTADGAVVQQTLRRVGRRQPLVLPPPRRRQVWAMLDGRISARWAWVRAWRPVWEAPWV